MNNFFTSKQIQSVTTKLPARRHEAVYNFHVYLNKKLPTSRYINKQNYFVLIEWFQQQNEFETEVERMSKSELNKCLQKFYLCARKRDGK